MTSEEDSIYGVENKEMEELIKNLHKLRESVAEKQATLELLQELMKHPVSQSLEKAHKSLEDSKITASSMFVEDLSKDLAEHVDEDITSEKDTEELKYILSKPHMQKLFEVHDTVAERQAERLPLQLHGIVEDSPSVSGGSTKSSKHLNCSKKACGGHRIVRMVGMDRKSWEPMGFTVVKQNGDIHIARIFHGSTIESQGLLHVDDIIREVNGVDVTGDPKRLQEYITRTTGRMIFKILPSYEPLPAPQMIYVISHMDYDPEMDDLIPCKKAGLKFNKGRVLLVVNQKEENWWQARLVNNKGEPRGCAGLIPSQSFEEKRRAIRDAKDKLPSEKRKSKRKKQKTMYSAAQNADFDKHDICVYEEVTCIPPFTRKTLILIVQSRSLAKDICQAIMDAVPELYEQPEKASAESTPSTKTESSKGSQEEILPEDELHSMGQESDGFQGINLESVRTVIKKGKTCVLAAPPQALKLLKSSEFMPYVVLVKVSDEISIDDEDKFFEMSEDDIEKYYPQYIDNVVSNSVPSEVASSIGEMMENLKSKHQWVPTSWVY